MKKIPPKFLTLFLVGSTFDKDKEKEITSDEKSLIKEFKKQFEDLKKKKTITHLKSVFWNADKITTNGLFVMS